jgi:hypothetical protein
MDLMAEFGKQAPPFYWDSFIMVATGPLRSRFRGAWFH